MIQIESRELGCAGAGKVEQAVDDFRGAEGLLRDLVQQRRHPLIAAHLLGQHLRVGGDDGQRSVDFMRHAGGQQPDGGELVGLRELCFQLHALGDVIDDNDAAHHLKVA